MTSTPPRTWERVFNRIERSLIDGTLQRGQRLPAERVLATELGVARSSVREAVRALEVLGLVRPRTGSGPEAGAVVVATPQRAMSSLLRLQVAARGLLVDDVVATRLVLETTVVESLATDQPVLDTAIALLDQMDDGDMPAGKFLALDARFHLALAEAAGNQVVAAIMTGLRSAVEEYARAGTAAIADWPRTASRLRAEHRAVIAAISAGEPAEAGSLVRRHISGYYAEAKLSLPPARPNPEGRPW